MKYIIKYSCSLQCGYDVPLIVVLLRFVLPVSALSSACRCVATWPVCSAHKSRDTSATTPKQLA